MSRCPVCITGREHDCVEVLKKMLREANIKLSKAQGNSDHTDCVIKQGYLETKLDEMKKGIRSVIDTIERSPNPDGLNIYQMLEWYAGRAVRVWKDSPNTDYVRSALAMVERVQKAVLAFQALEKTGVSDTEK